MPIVAVFGSSRATPDESLYRDAQVLGELLATEGFTVANGGYAGVMEAVSFGARSAGGDVIAVTAPRVYPGRRGTNAYVTTEIPTGTIAERIHRLIDLADATITMPGSLGTLAELIVSWNDGYVAPFRGATPKPHVVVGPVWAGLVARVAAEIEADTRYVECVDDVHAAVAAVTEGLGRARRVDIVGLHGRDHDRTP